MFNHYHLSLYFMARLHFSSKTFLNIFHLPTFFLLIGYVVFWIELFFVPSATGHTTWMAWIIFSFLFLSVLLKTFQKIKMGIILIANWWLAQKFISKAFIVLVLVFSLFILEVGFKVSFLPPHLPQEYDSLNYHLTIPRQHLILNSFKHLSWSAADLFLLPLDFAMAPYCLATNLPNKIAFFIFVLGVIGVAGKIVWRLSNKNYWSVLAIVMAVIGAHGLGIQFGVAMFDILLLYLFLAFIDSLLTGNIMLAAIEGGFYFWSKSFIPLQMVVLIVAMVLIILFFKNFGWQISDKVVFLKKRLNRKLFLCFIVTSFVIGGPFIFKSLYYAGTPLYPFTPGFMGGIYQNTDKWEEVMENSSRLLQTKDQYGSGRSVKSFLEHFWVLAVPDKEVNNRFDYPLGLPYLLVLGPFIFLWIESLLKRRFDVLIWFCVLFWMSWWMGSQQSRFLYVPVVLMMIKVLSDERFLKRIMFVGLFIALAFTSLSIFRAHKVDLFKLQLAVLREKDKELLEMSKSVDRSKPVELDFEDAAFADFLINVKANSSFVFYKSQVE